MSASPMARQAASTQAIPIRRVLLSDESELPNHYSQTPGGTLFSTTPGGTKIVYEKSFLLNLRNSPISRTPPTYDIPENLIRGSGSPPKKYHNNHIKRNSIPSRKRNDSFSSKTNSHDDDQFPMDL